MSMSETFTDKVALVTGAGAGMGLATARAFAAEGAAVVLADTNEDAIRRAADDLSAQGHRALAVVCDVAVESEVADLVTQTVDTFGRLDAAYNNAGVQTPNVETADADGAEFDRVQAINLRGVWNCMKYELRQMRAQGSGAIINCASIGGLIGIAGLASYHASKHGVLGMTKSAALEYAARGVRINAVCPGIIATPMVERMTTTDPEAMDALLAQQPIGRLGRPEEVAEAVLWLASDKSSFVIGHALAVDGGYTIQ
ncbi:glucose 1-dehydrogenase [Streptomyces sp. CA-179760]|uniref:glucose 1-dehydrogenase n=1 Tax=Streptomyces sp. CA-179760 TaxID=3240054 RepID=UPI003D913DF4